VITVALVLGKSGNLVSADASGHAGAGKRGTDIVCAAVTVLLRTALTVLGSRSKPQGSLSVEAKTAGRGSLAFCVTAFTEADIPLLAFAGMFLVEGLGSLATEYPDNIQMRVKNVND
jgi:uncharacterized protein